MDFLGGLAEVRRSPLAGDLERRLCSGLVLSLGCQSMERVLATEARTIGPVGLSGDADPRRRGYPTTGADLTGEEPVLATGSYPYNLVGEDEPLEPPEALVEPEPELLTEAEPFFEEDPDPMLFPGPELFLVAVEPDPVLLREDEPFLEGEDPEGAFGAGGLEDLETAGLLLRLVLLAATDLAVLLALTAPVFLEDGLFPAATDVVVATEGVDGVDGGLVGADLVAAAADLGAGFGFGFVGDEDDTDLRVVGAGGGDTGVFLTGDDDDVDGDVDDNTDGLIVLSTIDAAAAAAAPGSSSTILTPGWASRAEARAVAGRVAPVEGRLEIITAFLAAARVGDEEPTPIFPEPSEPRRRRSMLMPPTAA